MRAKALPVAFLMLAACASGPLAPNRASSKLISISHSPGFGGTYWYRLEISSDGHGRLRWNEGAYPHAYPRAWGFKVSPELFNQVDDILTGIRPKSGQETHESGMPCDDYATDQPVKTVEWTDGSVTTGAIFDYGCESKKNRELIQLVNHARIVATPNSLRKLKIWKLTAEE